MSQSIRHLSRSQILFDITRDYLRDTGISELAFSKLVFTTYLSLVPDEHQRCITVKPWHQLNEHDADRVIHTQYKRWQRYFAREVALPSDLEEAWVESLSEHYRRDAVTAMCGRYQMAAIEITQSLSCASVADYLLRDSDLVGAMAHILADGVVDERDMPHLPELEAAANKVVSAVYGMVDGVQETLGVPAERRVSCSKGQRPEVH